MSDIQLNNTNNGINGMSGIARAARIAASFKAYLKPIQRDYGDALDEHAEVLSVGGAAWIDSANEGVNRG